MTPATLFLVFNRPDKTAAAFAALRAAQPERLYVAADGPRADRPGEADQCDEARRIATQVDWPCEVRTLFRDENLGCRRAVSGAVTWFFEHEEAGIVLEDDCVPHPSFFAYCGEMLERHRDDKRVMCVTGTNFQSSMKGWPYSYYYSVFNHCWGWASWRRAWALYDAELEHFDPVRAERQLDRLCGVRGFGKHWVRIFSRVKTGELDSWASIWTWTCFRHGGLTCTPKVNLVSNIGFDDTATHTTARGSPFANMATALLPEPFRSPPDMRPHVGFDRHTARNHYGIGRRSLRKRIRRKLGRLVRAVIG